MAKNAEFNIKMTKHRFWFEMLQEIDLLKTKQKLPRKYNHSCTVWKLWIKTNWYSSANVSYIQRLGAISHLSFTLDMQFVLEKKPITESILIEEK